MIDTTKVMQPVSNQWEAVMALVKTEQHLLSALRIMESVLENRTEEDWEFHEKRIKEFLKQFAS